MIDIVITWLDRDRSRFWLVALVATLAWAIAVVWDRPLFVRRGTARENQRSWLLWSLASLLLLLAWRWPYLVGPAILNPDEAQMIAGAITLKHFPVYWKYVDGTTHGPLAELPLLLTHLLGIPLNYAGARLTAGLLILGGFILAGRGLMLVYAPRAVRIGLAPVILLWASVSFYDFAGYTSEQIAIFLLLASVWPIVAGFARSELPARRRAARLALGGFLLGCLPYAKLQGCLLGLVAGGIAAGAVLTLRHISWSEKLKLISGLVAGALMPTAIIAVYLWIWGLGPQFWAAYVLNNVVYSQTGFLDWKWVRESYGEFVAWVPGLAATCWIVLGLLVVWLALLFWPTRRAAIPVKPRLSPVGRWGLPVVAVLVLTSIYTTIAPGRPFHHYLQFLGIPLGLGGVVLCGEIWRVLPQHSRRIRVVFSTLAVIGIITPLVFARHARPMPDMFGLWTTSHGEWRSPASLAIARLAQPEDTLCVWGWMPFFYAETGLPQATREANNYRQIEALPMRDFYQARFLRDFRRHPPRIFVDAVGGSNFSYGSSRRQDCGYESFAPLKDLIDREYTLVEEVAGSRIFVRK